MTLSELLPALHELTRAEKLRAIQALSADLVDEDEAGLAHAAQHAVWSPYDAFDAAAAMSKYLEEHPEE